MRLIEIRIDGFGKLRGRTFPFDPHFTIVYGPNEAGKSTLAASIVAALARTEAMAPSDGSSCVIRPRSTRSLTPSSRDSTPATQAAAYSPRLCPIR